MSRVSSPVLENLSSLEINDLNIDGRLGNWDKEKIQFNEYSLCVYAESNNRFNYHPSTQYDNHNNEKDFVVIYNNLNTTNIDVAGRDTKVDFLRDKVIKCRAKWSSDG